MSVIYVDADGNEKMFFSVKTSCTIGGTPYRAAICYDIPESMASTIEKMEKQGIARRYDEEMLFVNGVARLKNKKQA